MTPHEDKDDVITPVNILFREGGIFYVMMMMIMIMIMTIVSVEQRPGWDEHIERMAC